MFFIKINRQSDYSSKKKLQSPKGNWSFFLSNRLS